jgi:regulator of sigma E protease
MLALLSVLILVHELGHFLAARKFGIRVERFGFGLPFGPTLYETKWGDTKVCVHSFLLGGYVSFPDDEPDSEIPLDSQERIANRKVWERFIVVSAGVTANAIIAYLIVLFVAGFSGGLPSGKYNIFVDKLQPEKTLSAHQIGIMSGDKIVYANDAKIDTFNKFIQIAHRSKKFDGYVSEDKIMTQVAEIKKLNPAVFKESDSASTVLPSKTNIILPSATPEEKIVISDDKLEGASKYTPPGVKLSEEERGLRNKISGKTSFATSSGSLTLEELSKATADTVHPIYITVLRNGKNVELLPAYPNEKGMIGVKLKVEEITEKVNSPVSAVTKSWNYLSENSYYMAKGLVLIITGQIPLSEVHGIVAITKVGSDIIEKRGIWDGLLLTALISMDLAIVNLLPIPALDGGHLLFLLIEKLRGRPVEEKTQEAFAKYGFVFLIGLMVIIIFNDIFALVTDKL